MGKGEMHERQRKLLTPIVAQRDATFFRSPGRMELKKPLMSPVLMNGTPGHSTRTNSGVGTPRDPESQELNQKLVEAIAQRDSYSPTSEVVSLKDREDSFDQAQYTLMDEELC